MESGEIKLNTLNKNEIGKYWGYSVSGVSILNKVVTALLRTERPKTEYRPFEEKLGGGI